MNKKLYLAIMLAVVSCGALAEWSKVDESDDSVVYINNKSIRKSGDMAKIWSLMDLKTPRAMPGKKDFQSTRTLFEFNCKEELYRRLSVAVFAGKMASGEMIFNAEEPSKWSHVAPGSLAEQPHKLGCLLGVDPK